MFVTVAGMLIALIAADAHTPGDDHFDPFRVGLDHLALAVSDPSQLAEMQRNLDTAGVRNNGVEEDPATHRQYISFYDPDGIAWELYAALPRPTAETRADQVYPGSVRSLCCKGLAERMHCSIKHPAQDFVQLTVSNCL